MTDEKTQPLPAEAAGDRQKQLEEFYFHSHADIVDAVLADHPKLLVADADNIAQAIAAHLADYPGPLNLESFSAWATSQAQSAASCMATFYELRGQHQKMVLAGIWSVLRGAADLTDYDDPKRTARALADEVWLWVFENLDSLTAPGTAEVGTRLHAKAYWTARAWKTARLRDRARRTGLDVARLGKDRDGTLSVRRAGLRTCSVA